MKSMDKDYIEQHDIAQRYLHGRLTPEEQEAFEVYLMENPEVLDTLEADLTFRNGLTSSSQDKGSEHNMSGLVRLWPWLATSGWIASASLAFVLFIGSPGLDTQPSPNMQIEYIETVRSVSEKHPQISVAPDAKTVVLMLLPNDLEADRFDVRVTPVDSEITMFLYEDLARQNSGELAIPLDTEKLSQGTYQISLSGVGTQSLQTSKVVVDRSR